MQARSPLLFMSRSRIYLLSSAEVVAVTNDRFELLAQNEMDERVIGSPVPVANRIFIRGENHLFCLGSPEAEN